jgi:hypothetical protein
VAGASVAWRVTAGNQTPQKHGNLKPEIDLNFDVTFSLSMLRVLYHFTPPLEFGVMTVHKNRQVEIKFAFQVR